MNLRTLRFPCFLLLAATLVFTACEKEGPAGPAGATGPVGPAGPAGPAGPTGTANVIYSAWLDVPFTRSVPAPGDTLYNATITATKLTQEILDRGEVKVYWNYRTAANPLVFPLPLDANVIGTIISPYYEVGKINLISVDDVSSFTTTTNQKAWQYRYILIPGGTTARTNINWNNYEEVKAYLGLKD